MKIVINTCFGGFGLSTVGMHAYYARKGVKVYVYNDTSLCANYFDAPRPDEFAKVGGSPYVSSDSPLHPIYDLYNAWYSDHTLTSREMPRDDTDLIAVVEELGAAASGGCADLRVVEIPDDVKWEIEEYDGREHVAETHRTWP